MIMSDNISVIIDGKSIEVPPGTLIIEAARRVGVEIPAFCYDDRLKPVGACRMCLVEVEKMPKLVASCATPVAPNMVILTGTEKVIKARKGVLEFLLINHPLDCPTCDKGGECPLQDNTFLYGPPISRYKENKIRFMDEPPGMEFDEIPLGPEILLCRNRCIMCYKCVRIVRDLAGEADLGVFQRGSSANIGVLEEVRFADEFSGNTVEYCPVGALTSRSFRYRIRDWLLKKAPSICNLCSDGCNMNVEWSHGKVYRHMSRRNPAVDDGWLCDRGRYGFDISRSEKRITQPHIRRGNALEPCGWDEADALAARHLSKLIDENRTSEIAVVGSSLLSNEEAYAIRRFFDDVVKTPFIDFQADTDQPIGPELLDMIGLDGTIEDIEKDSVFFFVGCDPAIEHPVLSLRIRRAISIKKARAAFIGSYDKRLGYFPVENVRIAGGAEVFAINYMLSVLAGNKTATGQSLIFDVDKLDKLTGWLGRPGNKHIIAGRDFFSHHDRPALLSSLIRLKKAANAKLSILPHQGNFMGVARFGLYGEPERSFNEFLSRVNSGDVKTMFVFGANPIDEYPDRKYVQETLRKLEFMVVVNPFVTPTAGLASILYPQALLPDYGGSFVNVEGRVQKFEPMAERALHEFRPMWTILGEISTLMESGQHWRHDSIIRQDMSEKLKGMEGFNNIPDAGMMANFRTENVYNPGEIPPAAIPTPPAGRPYMLHCTRTAHHLSWLTEYSENLMRISGAQVTYINPHDAAALDITDGNYVRIGGLETAINLRAVVSDKINKGEILVENSFAENPVNRLKKRGEAITFVSLKKS